MEKGFRQGDPLAPFLFLIVAEGLSDLFHQVVVKGRFTGFSFGIGLDVVVSILQLQMIQFLLARPVSKI